MARTGRFIVLGACVLVACNSASSGTEAGGGAGSGGGGGSGAGTAGAASAGASGSAAAFGGAGAPGAAGAPASAGSAGAAAAGASAGGAGSAGNSAGSAGSPVGGAGAGGSKPLFVAQVLYGNPASCLPRVLPTNPLFQQTTCEIVEAVPHACSCTYAGRAVPDAAHITAVSNAMRASGACDANGTPACTDFCMCHIIQEGGVGGEACKADPVAAGMNGFVLAGFCYDDDPTSPQLANCPANEKQKLLFVSKSDEVTPSPGALVFLMCPG